MTEVANSEADASVYFLKKNSHNAQKTLGQPPNAPYYNMTHEKPGTALIINHMYYENPNYPSREGTDVDREALISLFNSMNFQVSVHDDLKVKEFFGLLEEVSKMDHSDSDCFVMVVMSHGDSGKIYAYDGEYETKQIWSYFTGEKCPGLRGKPKLFFIQACRGTGLDYGSSVQYSQVDSQNTMNTYTIPNMADILIMYSTVDGYYSWRNARKGSCFIQTLVSQMDQHGKNLDLLTILTLVNRDVAVNFTAVEDSVLLTGCKQMCSIVSMLTRILYFNPGTTVEES